MNIKRNAFTLIELLVVIAIIAILAAILFPVFAQAKTAAKKAVSLSNAKQSALAEFMYNNDNDGVYVSSWARGFPGDALFWAQPYMKSLQVIFEPNKNISTASLVNVCSAAAGDPYGSYEMQPGGRDNPTGESQVWGWGINKGVNWMDGYGIENNSFSPANRGQVVQVSLNGLTVNATVWSVHQGRSESSVVAPASIFFMANSGELPRMSIQLEAMTPVGYPGHSDSPCFIAAHQGMPYAGGYTYMFCDGHVKWEKYNPTATGSVQDPTGYAPGGGLPMISSNPCRYIAEHDPSENYGGCQNGWN